MRPHAARRSRRPRRRGIDIGERLRSIRSHHALSQRALAKRAGVTNGIISLIEQNRSSPSVATLKRILDGFPMSLAEFFSVGEPTREPTFYRASDLVEIGGRLISYRQVGGNLAARSMQILHERIEPGADTGPELFHHEAEEGGVVIRGAIEVTVGSEKRTLRVGDAYYFNSRIPHRFRNAGTEVCEIVSACTPPSF